MSRKVIMLDVDGVLANFTYGFSLLANEMFGFPVVHTHEQPTWNFSGEGRLTKVQESAVWTRIRQTVGWWEGLQPLVSPSVFCRISNLGGHHEVLFTTSRVSSVTPPGAETKAWLHTLGVLLPSVIVSPKKGEIARAVGATHSLEDKAENAWSIHWISDIPQTASYLINRPYNQVQTVPEIGARVKRVASVEAFLDIVEGGGA